MTAQYDFDYDVKESVKSIYPTLLSHTAECYPTLPVVAENKCYNYLDEDTE